MLIGMHVRKCMVSITEMEDDSSVKENYEIENHEKEWNTFVERYSSTKPEIALEQSSSGKYVERFLRNMGF